VVFFLLTLGLALSGSGASAQTAESGAIEKLSFLVGSWHCVIEGAKVPKGDVSTARYQFSPDRSWLIEYESLRERGRSHWSMQIWGYNALQQKLVAYDFSAAGVLTKSVDGWVGGEFKSKRDQDGATVTIVPHTRDSFDWKIVTANGSTTVIESCRRSAAAE
jgi:hypothetical protein